MLTTDLKISRLGFGLSGIAGSGNFSHQEKLIRTAIDCGITHFDVAPYYGSGDAEGILGKILSKGVDKVSITTKYGLIPVSGGKAGKLVRNAIRPIFKRFKFLKRISTSVVNAKSLKNSFTYQRGLLTNSLEQSIKKIGRPVDILILHDMDPEYARNCELGEELKEVRRSSKSGFIGISGTFEDVQLAYEINPELFRVVQFENSLKVKAQLQVFNNSKTKIITHRAIQGGLSELKYLLDHRPGFIKIWNSEFGIEPSQDNLSRMLIELALSENKQGTLLFSTTQFKRIESIAQVISSPILRDDDCIQLRKLFNMVKISDH